MRADGTVHTTEANKMALAYRSSCYQKNGEVITSGVFRLEAGAYDDIQDKMVELMGRRRSKQPLEYPSAGSTFKRPEGQFAGKLIEDCGLRGYTVGGAQVSEKHCGFVINKDHATAGHVMVISKINSKPKADVCMMGMLTYCNCLSDDEISFLTENKAVADFFVLNTGRITGNENAVLVTEQKKRNGVVLYSVLPSVEDFPYAIRVVSEVVSSNGSTSQGSICGSG